MSYTTKACYLFLKYPPATWRLVHGLDAAQDCLNRAIANGYLKSPISIKQTRRFSIYLNPQDEVTSPFISAECHEPEMTALSKKILKPGMTMVDVGAHVGWYTLLAASIVGRVGRVVSFEPEPNNFALLSQSVRLNSFNNVELLDKAVGSANRISDLFLASWNLGSHSIISRSGGHSIKVQVVTLDDELPKLGLGSIDLLKIDVEGAEVGVIRGSRKLLPKVRNIIVEYNPLSWGSETQTLYELLGDFEAYQEVRSPFLVRPIPRKEIGEPHKTRNLFFRRRGISGIA